MAMELITTHPIKKSDLGFHGNLFGGKLLAWIDAAAAGYSMQLCDSPRMVTVSIDKCYFEKPAREGQLLKIYGHPSKLGNTSITSPSILKPSSFAITLNYFSSLVCDPFINDAFYLFQLLRHR